MSLISLFEKKKKFLWDLKRSSNGLIARSGTKCVRLQNLSTMKGTLIVAHYFFWKRYLSYTVTSVVNPLFTVLQFLVDYAVKCAQETSELS